MHIRSFLSSLAFLAMFALPSSAEQPVLVELFAAQNCSACPKAHRTLAEVEETRDDVVILTWSVDYWDYLGDKDPMAMEESKRRQSDYVERFKLRGPYTPQTVYNGVQQCPGNKPSRVERNLESVAKPADVTLEMVGETVTINGPEQSKLVDIWLVDYLEGDANTTDMVNPVIAARSLSQWVGGETSFDRSECSSNCAVIVQQAGHGDVLATMALP